MASSEKVNKGLSPGVGRSGDSEQREPETAEHRVHKPGRTAVEKHFQSGNGDQRRASPARNERNVDIAHWQLHDKMNEKVSTDSRAKRGRSSGLLRRDSGKPARYAATGLTKKDEGAWNEKRAR
jgi:hypothetical protein